MNKGMTPSEQGYRMPAEWEPHAATWLSWPHKQTTWPGQDLALVESAYFQIVAALAPGERVRILMRDEATRDRVQAGFEQRDIATSQLDLLVLPTDDAWIRDYGPNFLVRDTPEGREVAFNKWQFDSWGGKYPHKKDNQVGEVLAGKLGLPVFRPDIVLEGGAIEVDGQGRCMTTSTCLLNPNRNGGLSREAMENYLAEYLGAGQVIWLEGGIEGDDTDGHIDNLARFASPDTVLLAFDEKGPDFLENNLRRLEDAGVTKLIPLPLPAPVGPPDTPLPASHLNFYIGNRVVLCPVYGGPSDAVALEKLAEAFPGRAVVPIGSEVLIWGLGSIHCLTQQEPAGMKTPALNSSI